MKNSKIILFLLTMLSGSYSYCQPDKLDNTFSNDGLQTTTIGTKWDIIYATALQSDGKILAVGTSESTTEIDRIALVRYNSNGSLDNSFGSAGKVIITVSKDGDWANTVAIQNDGKIIVGGVSVSGGTWQSIILRCKTNGTLDSSFSGDGIFVLPGTNGGLNSIILQPNGKILAGGGNEFCIVRFNTDGSLDNTFGGDGMINPVISQAGDEVSELMLQTDGKIVAAGTAYISSSETDFCVARFNSDGSFDNTFSSDGKVMTNISDDDVAQCAALQSDGKIIVGGDDRDIWLIRYNADGSLDNSFGNAGKVKRGFSNWGTAMDMVLQADGKIITTGTLYDGIVDLDFLLIRFNANGTEDFLTSISFNASADDEYSYSVLLQPDGKIIIAGVSSDGFALARYIGGKNLGISNLMNANPNIKVYPNPINQNSIISYQLTSEATITIQLFDIEGREIKTYLKDALQKPGEYKQFIGLPEDLAAGNYLIRISSLEGSYDIKILK